MEVSVDFCRLKVWVDLMTYLMSRSFCCICVSECDWGAIDPSFALHSGGLNTESWTAPSFIRSIIAIRSQLTNTIKRRGGMWDYRFNEPFVQTNYMWMRVCRSSSTPYIYHRWTPNKPLTHIQTDRIHNVKWDIYVYDYINYNWFVKCKFKDWSNDIRQKDFYNEDYWSTIK